VRVISPPLAAPEATRVEVVRSEFGDRILCAKVSTQRVPGADMNPFFTIAAIVGLGTYGIKHKLPLDLPPISAAKSRAHACFRRTHVLMGYASR
jgi:glutamine synthetase